MPWWWQHTLLEGLEHDEIIQRTEDDEETEETTTSNKSVERDPLSASDGDLEDLGFGVISEGFDPDW